MTSKEYPVRVAYGLLSKTLRDLESKYRPDDFESKDNADLSLDLPSAKEDFVKYQKPDEADALLKVQKDLEEVKDIMHRNIEELLKRGESLESLMEKSKDLSTTSYAFYSTAKKNNQCCTLY